MSGFLLLRVAAGLRKRKRVAWQIAVACHLRDDRGARLPWPASRRGRVISLLLLLMLLTARSRSRPRPDAPQPVVRGADVRAVHRRRARRRPGHALCQPPGRRPAVVCGCGLRRCWRTGRDRRAASGFSGDRFGDIFHGTLVAFGLFTVVVVALLALRPQEPIAALSVEDERRLRALLAKHGERDSLGYFALRRDKSVRVVAVAARRRSPTASCTGSRWPAAIRSAIPRRGPARSTRTARLAEEYGVDARR